MLFERIKGGDGSWVLLSSTLATAVRGCREALMSCIMGVRRDGRMEGWGKSEGPKPDPCPSLRFAALLRLWAKVNVEPPAACVLRIRYCRTNRKKINCEQRAFLCWFLYIVHTANGNYVETKQQHACALVLMHVWVQEEARGRKEADSYGDLIPLDISWLGECGGTPCFMELAWII